MLTVQRQLFDAHSSACRYKWLDGGCYSNVWEHPDGHSVIKQGGSDDGTLAYLYWCYEYQQACGKPMQGMPEVYSLAFDEGRGYVCTMKRYSDLDDSWFIAQGIRSYQRECLLPYMAELISKWAEASDDVFGYEMINDLHSGNFMMDGDTLIMLDPSGHGGFSRSQLSGLKRHLCEGPEHFALTLN